MLFNSLNYLIFLPLVVILYFTLPAKIKKIFLLMASFFFYGFWNVKYLLLMILSIGVTFYTGIYIDENSKILSKKKLAVFICFFINLGILFLFKYANFFIDLVNSLTSLLSLRPIESKFSFLLPVGISFYTFQALGYTLDVYRNEIPAERNFINYALFVSFFPQLVAGPIERSKNLLGQVKVIHKFKYENLLRGFILILWGFSLKLLIADRAAILVNEVFENYHTFNSLILLLTAIFFTFQIYCDFYSYSIIAQGSAKILGIDLMDNFKEPFLSKSIAEFWHRWHISLSTWFRDYLYIPLGGNRTRLFRNLINILIVFLVSGLWHGANMTFVLWGLIHGIFNSLETFITKKNIKIPENFLTNFFRRILTFIIVVFAFIFFRAENIHDGLNFIGNIFAKSFDYEIFLRELSKTDFGFINLYPLLISLALLFFIDIFKYNGINLILKVEKLILPFRWIVLLLMIFTILIFGVYGPGFSESQFIYFQF